MPIEPSYIYSYNNDTLRCIICKDSDIEVLLLNHRIYIYIHIIITYIHT